MTFPQDELPAVADAAHAVMYEAQAAGVWVFGGGFMGYHPYVVNLDGSVKAGPLAESPVHLGGFAVIDVPTQAEAFEWAHKIGVSCRCAQEVREFIDDPEA
jgi:hypothetical protein